MTTTKQIILLLAALMFLSCRFSYYEPYFQTAERFYEAGDYTRAIEMYLKAIGENGKRPESYFGLALAYDHHGDLEGALLALEKTLELDPLNALALDRLASINLDLGHVDSALAISKRAVQLDSEYVEAFNTLGHAYFESGDLDSAERTFAYALGLSEKLEVHDLQSARYSVFIDERSEAYNGLGEICNARGFFYRGLDYFASSIILTPYWDTPWFNKAIAYQGLGSSMAAQVAYLRAIDLAPSNLRAYKNLAQLYQKLGKSSDAIDVYRNALRVDSSDLDVYYGLASIYQKIGDLTRAAEVYAEVIQHDPDEPKGYYLAGQLEIARSHYDLAAEFFQEAVNLDTDYAEAHNALGETYRAQGLRKQAQSEFERAFLCDSTFALPLRNLGSLMIELGREEEGVQDYRRAAALGDFDAMVFLRSRGIEWDRQ